MDETTNSVVEDAEVVLETEGTEDVIGNVKIAVEVVSTIAGIATEDIDGVAYMYSSFAGGIAERFGAKKNPSKGVKIEMKEHSVVVDLYLVVDYGIRIPELAWEIQENVKNSIETMTGLGVEKVNIHIEGVSFEKQKTASQEEERAALEAEQAAQLVQDVQPNADTDSGEELVFDDDAENIED